MEIGWHTYCVLWCEFHNFHTVHKFLYINLSAVERSEHCCPPVWLEGYSCIVMMTKLVGMHALSIQPANFLLLYTGTYKSALSLVLEEVLHNFDVCVVSTIFCFCILENLFNFLCWPQQSVLLRHCTLIPSNYQSKGMSNDQHVLSSFALKLKITPCFFLCVYTIVYFCRMRV